MDLTRFARKDAELIPSQEKEALSKTILNSDAADLHSVNPDKPREGEDHERFASKDSNVEPHRALRSGHEDGVQPFDRLNPKLLASLVG